MKESKENLLKRAEEAWGVKQNWHSLYRDAYELALPQREMYSQYEQGSKKGEKVYDSTLQRATISLAGKLQANITPPFTRWSSLHPGPFNPNREDIAVQEELEDVTETLFAIRQQSNFDMAVGEMYLDYVVGTGAMLVLPDRLPKRIKYITVPNFHIALEDGPDNMIGGIYRRFEKPARTISTMWPEAKQNSGLSEIVSDDPSKNIQIEECTYYDYQDRVWRYCVILKNISNMNDSKVYYENQSRTCPWIIARWIKVAGEVFGRGPVLQAMYDALTANKAKDYELRIASLKLAGMFLVRNNAGINPKSLKVKPGVGIPVRNTGGPMGADIVPLEVGGDIQFAQIIQSELQQAIKDAMFDKSVPEPGAVRSATEWVYRNQELQEAIGAPFGRFHSEFIRPLHNRELEILFDQKVLTQPIPIDGNFYDVSIISSLAQAQALKDVEAITNWAQLSIQLAGQEAFMGSAKIENLTRVLGRMLGITSKLIRSEEEQAEIVAQAQQTIQQVQQAQQGQIEAPVEGEIVQ